MPKIDPHYRSLHRALMLAYEQAATGKGKQRHADDIPFENQKMLRNARKYGYKALLFQAVKKAEESVRLHEIYGVEATIRELLGAINYLAAAVILLEERGTKNKGDE